MPAAPIMNGGTAHADVGDTEGLDGDRTSQLFPARTQKSESMIVGIRLTGSRCNHRPLVFLPKGAGCKPER